VPQIAGAPMPALIKALNRTLRVWGNHHRHVVASEAFSQIDNHVFGQLWRLLRRRHPNKPKKWLVRNYWTAGGTGKFSFRRKLPSGSRIYHVFGLCSLGIRRHIKIRAAANPYTKEDAACFWRRRNVKESNFLPGLTSRESKAIWAS